MPDEPLWLTADELIAFNRLIVDGTREPFGLLKPNELESACARPRNMWSYGEERLAFLATALIIGIGRNHPFMQGNKRTAFMGALAFFQNNGWHLDHPDTEDFGPLIEGVIVGRMGEDEFAREIDSYLIEKIAF